MKRAEAEAILDGDRETALALLMRVGELIEANRRLESHVADLEQRLNRNSRNSSLPPSQDPSSAPPRPQRHQVYELPAIAVWVSAHGLHRLRCPGGAAETRAQLPAGVPPGAFCHLTDVLTARVRGDPAPLLA